MDMMNILKILAILLVCLVIDGFTKKLEQQQSPKKQESPGNAASDLEKDKVPKLSKKISRKICPNKNLKKDKKAVEVLYKTLKFDIRKTSDLSCKAPSLVDVATGDSDHVITRRNAGGCPMDNEELSALADIQLAGAININDICVQKLYGGSCTERGEVNYGTNTYNMCKECFFVVHLPSSYSPNAFLHSKCGDGGDLLCLSGEGACVKRQLGQQVRTAGNVYIGEIFLTTACSCEVPYGGLFSIFVPDTAW